MNLENIHTFVKGGGYKWSSAAETISELVMLHWMFNFIKRLDSANSLHYFELLDRHLCFCSFFLSFLNRRVR